MSNIHNYPSIEEQKETMGRQPDLYQQDLSSLDLDNMTALSEDVISRQATINIGTIGHVAHGKSTVVKGISGVNTVRFHKEKIRNITIKLGYANAKIFKCPSCPSPECFQSFGSEKEDYPQCTREGCSKKLQLIRHISFVDCPGHDVLMATMLTGAAVMDAALLIVSANESCPQPQTQEHLAAVEIMKLKHLIILQNKIDIVLKDNSAQAHFEDIKKFVSGTCAEGAPIIPISAQLKYNLDMVCQYITRIPIPIRDFKCPPKMMIIRSFDVNKPGEDIESMRGGVVGGTILEGVLRVGDEIEIRPGIVVKEQQGQFKCTAIFSRIVELKADNNNLLYAVPGGLIGVGLKVDPSLTGQDHLTGHVLGHPGKLPDVLLEIDISFYLLRRLLGVRSDNQSKSGSRVDKLKKSELLMVNVGSKSSGAQVLQLSNKGVSVVNSQDFARIKFMTPVVATEGDKVALSRRIDKNFRLIGWGEIKKGYAKKN